MPPTHAPPATVSATSAPSLVVRHAGLDDVAQRVEVAAGPELRAAARR